MGTGELPPLSGADASGRDSMTPADEIARCAKEQAACGDYIRAGLPDQRGAQRGAEDWLMEEALIRRENSFGLIFCLPHFPCDSRLPQ